MTDARTPTPVDASAERYYDAAVALDPCTATHDGVPGYDDQLPEYSPDWFAERSELRRRTLHELHALEPADAIDRVTIAALREELGAAEALRDSGAEESDLNVIDSPIQNIRDVFDLNSTATADDWATIARRLAAVPASLHGFTRSLRYAAERGRIAARRQVQRCAEQCAEFAAHRGVIDHFATTARTAEGPLPDAVHRDVHHGAEAARHAYAELARFLRDELLDRAPETDGVGRDRYPLYSRIFLGAQVDLEETYAWGQAELARIVADMAATAERIRPGATTEQAIEALDADPARKLAGTAALQAWMQETSDAALAALAGVHFDIPEPIRRLECRIAPTHQGGIYYTGPSEDLETRPGRMWWSVPEGVTEFATWRERTTVYHEGVPGHHLQIAQTAYRRNLLNRWRRVGSWVSGHGEGWALYAERLMADLGYLDDPADYLGMLDGQSLRAARVVLDIGVHCDFPAPDEVGGGKWTYEKAWQFLTAHANMAEGFLRFELDRYLGWPGQAPSYKIGERLWLQLREEAARRAGADFDVRAFHRAALDVGSVGLDVLRTAVLSPIGES
jgi:uncharacterized protein (DUF885 family)